MKTEQSKQITSNVMSKLSQFRDFMFFSIFLHGPVFVCKSNDHKVWSQ